jgi:hypothetical protein
MDASPFTIQEHLAMIVWVHKEGRNNAGLINNMPVFSTSRVNISDLNIPYKGRVKQKFLVFLWARPEDDLM